MNGVGWAFSFAWRTGTDNLLWIERFAGVDLALARACFEISAEDGFWAALNNLGVIWRDGLGVTPDPDKAFAYFRKAAESGEAAPLRHLARCYQEGFGCPIDYDMAAHLESMVSDIEAASASKAIDEA